MFCNKCLIHNYVDIIDGMMDECGMMGNVIGIHVKK